VSNIFKDVKLTALFLLNQDKSCTLKYLLLLSKSYKEKQTDPTRKPKGKKSAKTQDKSEQEFNFSNVEDEILNKVL
jgi:NRPS condensation-like uncharacterized protein